MRPSKEINAYELIDVFNLVQKIESDKNFKQVDEAGILELVSNGEILARITERKIPRIAELYQQGEVELGLAKQYDETSNVGSGIKEYDNQLLTKTQTAVCPNQGHKSSR